VTGAWLCW